MLWGVGQVTAAKLHQHGIRQVDEHVRPELPFGEVHRDARDTVVDAVRERFGTGSLQRGTLLGNDTGLVMPMLPD